jgi:hypothetical protein
MRYFGGDFSDVKGVRSMKPYRELSVDDFFQQNSRMGFRSEEKGVVIEGKVPDAVVPVPEKDFFKNVIGVPAHVAGMDDGRGAIPTPVRTPYGGQQGNGGGSMKKIEGGVGKGVQGRRFRLGPPAVFLQDTGDVGHGSQIGIGHNPIRP